MCISVRICQSSDYSIAEMDSYEVQTAVKFCNMEAEPDHKLMVDVMRGFISSVMAVALLILCLMLRVQVGYMLQDRLSLTYK